MIRYLLHRASPIAVALLSTLGTQAALAATDSAPSIITLQFNDNIDIEGVDNITFTDPTMGDLQAIDDFCIRGTGFSTFSILFESANGAGTFILTDGMTNVPYQVGYDNSLVGAFTPVTEGVALMGQPRQDAGNCTGAPDNSRFEVTILNADWDNPAVLDGTTYTDTLTITVTSE